MIKNEGDPMAAQLLAVSSSAYAAYATDRFFEKLPDVKIQFGETAFNHWKEHFAGRIRELSVAIAETEPALFVSRIRWSRAAFQARKVSEDLLRDSLVCLAEVLEEELPAACRRVPAEYITSALISLDESERGSKELDTNDPTSKLAMMYLLKVLDGNSRDAIQMVVDARDNGLPLEDTYQVLLKAQMEIGRMWHEAEVNIAEEHVVTSTTERAMSVLAYRADRLPPTGLTVVSAAVAGNAHDIGVRLVSDFFEFAGWRSICLGANLPPEDIAQAVEFFEGSLVLLSAALSTQLSAMRDTIQAVKQLAANCKVMVGGTAFEDAPDLWAQLGADAFASHPQEAVTIGSQLIQN